MVRVFALLPVFMYQVSYSYPETIQSPLVRVEKHKTVVSVLPADEQQPHVVRNVVIQLLMSLITECFSVSYNFTIHSCCLL